MADETAPGGSVYKVRVTAAQLRHFPQPLHLGDPGPLLKNPCRPPPPKKIAPKSHFAKIVLEDRVSVRIKIIIGFPEIRKTKKSKNTQLIFLLDRQVAIGRREEKEGERRGRAEGGG